MKFVNMAAIIMKCQVVHIENGPDLKATKEMEVKTGNLVLYHHCGKYKTGCVQSVTKVMNDNKYLEGPTLSWCLFVVNTNKLANLQADTAVTITRIKAAQNRPKADLRDSIMLSIGMKDE